MNGKISGEKLLELFTHEMMKNEKFTFISGIQPFKINFDTRKYFIYIKNISSAYFKNRPDVNRAQLPMREEFNFIKKSDIPFIFLGYDEENDIYVCWDYFIAKHRLNSKDNVSFYSRQSWQNQVTENEFLRKQLTNGDEIVLFKRKQIVNFFKQINSFFTEIGTSGKDASLSEVPASHVNKIFKITDIDLLNQLKPLLTGNTFHTLEAIQLVQTYYQDIISNF